MTVVGIVQAFIKYTVVLHAILQGIDNGQEESAVGAPHLDTTVKKLNFVERVAWEAQPPSKPAKKLKLPVSHVIISETATPPCFTEAECIYQVRHVQLSDILSLNLTDIGCNFMIGGDGNVYVGRGWDTVGEGLHGYNPISIGICFIGKFDTVEPQRQQLVIAQKLLEFGLIDGKIVSYYQLLGIRQISGKLNPGIALYKIIQTWSHWVDKIPEEARVPPEEKLYLIQRVAWGAQPSNKPVPRLKHPVQYVIISETATVGCSTQSECVYRVRMAQTYDIEALKWDDVGCNFMIGGDGYAYVGRGWEGVAEGLYGYGPLSVGITFIGTFKNAEPPSIQLKAAQQLIKLGVDEGMIDPDYKLLALRQIAHNSNPEDALYSIVKKWPHWIDSSEETPVATLAEIGPSESGTDLGDDIHIFTKKQWGGQEIANQYGTLAHPTPLVIIGHTGQYTGKGTTFEDCSLLVQDVQSFVVDRRKWVDIPYNFLIAGDGNVYEALGWDTQNPRHKNSLWVSFVGNYVYLFLDERQEKALHLLLKKGVELGKLDENYSMIAHRQFADTLSPGQHVISAMQQWPHYDNRTYTRSPVN